MPRDAMTCDEVAEGLERHVDGELGGAAAARFQAHLEACPACAEEYRWAQTVRHELRALPELDAPTSVIQAARHEIERERFGQPASSRRASRSRWAALAAAALATAVIGLSVWRAPDPRPAIEPGPAAPDAAEIARATEEARFALATMSRITRRAGLKLRDNVLIEHVAEPTLRGFSRALAPFGVEGETDPKDDRDRSS